MPQVRITKLSSAKVHTGAVYTLLKDDEEPCSFYSAGGDGNVIKWTAADTTNALIVAKVQAAVLSLLLLPGNDNLVIGQMQGGIHVIDLVGKKELKHLTYHQQGVFDLLYDDKHNHIIACGGDGILSFWNSEFLLQHSIPLSSKSVRSMAFSLPKDLIAAGCSDNSAYIIDCDDFTIRHQLQDHQNSVFSVSFSPDGKHLLTGSRDAHLRIWDAANDFRFIKAIPAHLFTINSIAYCPNGKIFATASRDKTIKVWSADNFELLKVIDKEKSDGHVNSVNKLIWISENALISCSDDRNIMVWKVDT